LIYTFRTFDDLGALPAPSGRAGKAVAQDALKRENLVAAGKAALDKTGKVAKYAAYGTGALWGLGKLFNGTDH
jgi:hypothetical protein